jgi:hypothetical protein
MSDWQVKGNWTIDWTSSHIRRLAKIPLTTSTIRYSVIRMKIISNFNQSVQPLLEQSIRAMSIKSHSTSNLRSVSNTFSDYSESVGKRGSSTKILPSINNNPTTTKLSVSFTIGKTKYFSNYVKYTYHLRRKLTVVRKLQVGCRHLRIEICWRSCLRRIDEEKPKTSRLCNWGRIYNLKTHQKLIDPKCSISTWMMS